MRFPRTIIWSLALSLLSIPPVILAFFPGSYKCTGVDIGSTFRRLGAALYHGLQTHALPQSTTQDSILFLHYLAAWPWYAWLAIRLPEPLQDPQIAIPVLSAVTWGLLGLLLGFALDWRHSRRLAQIAEATKIPDEARKALSFRRRSRLAASWCAGSLLFVFILTCFVLPPILTNYWIACLKSPNPEVRLRGACAFSMMSQQWYIHEFDTPFYYQDVDENWNPIWKHYLLDFPRNRDRLKLASETLLSLTKDPDMKVRQNALLTLGRARLQPERSIRALLSALDDPEVRLAATYALQDLGVASHEIRTRLALLASDSDEQVREQAVMALHYSWSDDTETLSILLGLLKSPDSKVRTIAAMSIRRRTALYDTEIQPLIAALKDPEATIRSFAVSTLGSSARHPDVCVPALITAIEDADLDVSVNAIQALGAFGPAARSALPALHRALNDPFLARAAADAIKKIEP